MKKELLIIGIAVLMIGLTGCKKEETIVETQTETLDLTVLHKDWLFDTNTMQFYYHFDVPEITPNLYNYGTWTLSRELFKGDKNAYQVTLPISYFMTDTLSNMSVVYYTQYIDYLLGVGFVEVQLTNSDYYYATNPDGSFVKPDDMNFRLQLIY